MNLFKDRVLLINLIPLTLSLAITIATLLFSKSLPNQLPLFYSLPWGESELATIDQVLVLPATMVLIDLINLVFYWQLPKEQTLLKNLLIATSLASSLILTITYLKIMLIFL